MTAVITTEQLTKSYGSHRGITEVDLEVREGEAFGFLGPNGAGKTTMIRTLLDHIRPTSGRALVFGIELELLAKPAQVHKHIFCCLVTLASVLGERLRYYPLERVGRFSGITRERRRLFVQYRSNNIVGRLAFERKPPGNRFVEHHSQTEDVRTRVNLLAPRLLRRHIPGSADD